MIYLLADAAATLSPNPFQPTLAHYLVIAAILMGMGVAALILRRETLGKLLGIELMTAAAGLNIVAFAAYGPRANIDGEILALVATVIGAVQGALAVAIVVNLSRAGTKSAEVTPHPN